MEKMKKLLAIFLTMMIAWTLAGCAGGTTSTEGSANGGNVSSPAPVPNQSAAASKKTEYPLSVTDSTGQTFVMAKAPERIVSMSPAETEILFALGLGDKLYGVSDFCDYPEAAKTKPKVGGIRNPNTEAVLGASPDLVMGGISTDEGTVAKLRELGLTVYKAEPDNLEDVMNNILTIGKLTDTQEQAEKLVQSMKDDKQRVVNAVKGLTPEQKLKVYMEFSPGWTVGKGEYMHEMIELSGAVNIASDVAGWNKINEEKIIQDNPDVILFTKDLIDNKTKLPLEEIIKTRSGWDKIVAIQKGRLHGLDQNILSRPGPRIMEGLINMAKAVYPDLVK
jgi:iron complex transport system substrate-binding protein